MRASKEKTRTNRLALTIATWFGCGYSPAAPGTAGTVGALVIAIPLAVYAGWRPWYFAILAVVFLAPAIWSAGTTARIVGKKDPGLVVVDEVIGEWITLAGATAWNWKSFLLAFVLFRLFDIWKPPPVRQLEALPEGVGIVADDAMAGVYGAVILFLAGRLHLY